jgi:polyisoprenoid-binding protein YceI
MPSTRSRRFRVGRLVVIALVALAVVFVGGPFVYIHFIEGPAPKPLSLPRSHVKGTADVPSGTWHATTASTVGYRVHEVLFGQNNEAVGRTHAVTGSITLSRATVTKASFTVEMSTVRSDQHMRDVQFDGRIMDVAQYPTATFTLHAPIALNAGDKAGVPVSALASGDLTLRGQTHRVTFDVTASYSATTILINGSIPIEFDTWHIPYPGFPGITVDNHGTLEFLLTLHPGAA